MSEDEIYQLGKNFEEKLAKLLEEHEIYYQTFPFFRFLKEGHKAVKNQLILEEKEVV
ncbi:MAG: hypothetical protein JST55_01925 [Bacteroidetes bacterium]|nr:hypothetical protein [Bacteroidota bacterium]